MEGVEHFLGLCGLRFLSNLSKFSKLFHQLSLTQILLLPAILSSVDLELSFRNTVAMSNHSITASTTESRALELLGAGAPPSAVASALGVTESTISQFLSSEHFSKQVTELRYKNLLKHNARDTSIDELEDKLIKKMGDLIPFMHKPGEVFAAFAKINAAKRRGVSSPDQIAQQKPVTQLILPIQIIQQFQVNGANQVVRAGQQDLITVQSGRMHSLASPTQINQVNHVENDSSRAETAPAS